MHNFYSILVNTSISKLQIETKMTTLSTKLLSGTRGRTIRDLNT